MSELHQKSSVPESLAVKNTNPSKSLHIEPKMDLFTTKKSESRSLPTTPGSAGIISVVEIDYIIPKSKRLRSWSSRPPKQETKPTLRFYSIGPSTHHIKCPLCKQRADTETAQLTGTLGHVSCLLSAFSW